jgi:hypothetical protein
MMGVDSMKLQNAMEFVSTYGLAIIIIGVATATLYAIGAFRGSASLVNTCTGGAGYSCTNSTLYSNGVLSVTLGSVGNPILVTGLGCSRNQTKPQDIIPTNIALSPGSSKHVNFDCAWPSNVAVTSFSGSLWVVGSSGYQTNVAQEVATVNVHAQPSTSYSTTTTPTTTIPARALWELNDATFFGFRINSSVIAANSVSQCSLFSVEYCNNNQWGDNICINNAYFGEMEDQYNSIYYINSPNPNGTFIGCSEMYFAGTMSCLFQQGYCVVNDTGNQTMSTVTIH